VGSECWAAAHASREAFQSHEKFHIPHGEYSSAPPTFADGAVELYTEHRYRERAEGHYEYGAYEAYFFHGH
jgi:hypothetical protein